MEHLCENCDHWIENKPIGGILPSWFAGKGSCYPNGIKNKKYGVTNNNDICKIDNFKRKQKE